MKTEAKTRELKPIGKAATLPPTRSREPSNRETRKTKTSRLALNQTVGYILVFGRAEQEGASASLPASAAGAHEMLKLESVPCIVLSSKEASSAEVCAC